MSYSKFFNIQKVKDSDRVCCKLQCDLAELSYNGNEGVLSKGDYFNVRTKEEQIEDLTKGLAEGRMDEELFNKRLESVNKIPDFVFAHVHAVIDGKYFPIGDILNRRDGSGKYMKLKVDQAVLVDSGDKVLFKKDGFINIASKSDEIKRIDYLLSESKMKQETYDTVRKSIDDTPDFVLFRCDGKGQVI